MPTSSTHWATRAGGNSRLMPRVSTTSAEPHRLEAERLPCLATFSPVPATTNAVAVEMLKVPVASPPVPQVSISISRSVPVSAASTSPRVRTRATLSRITSAKPVSSSTVSPFMRSAVRKAATWAWVAPPDMIASMAAAASRRVRSRRSTRVRIASTITGLLIVSLSSGPFAEVSEDPPDSLPREELRGQSPRPDAHHGAPRAERDSAYSDWPLSLGAPRGAAQEGGRDRVHLGDPERLRHHPVHAVGPELIGRQLDAPAGDQHHRDLGPQRLDRLGDLPPG